MSTITTHLLSDVPVINRTDTTRPGTVLLLRFNFKLLLSFRTTVTNLGTFVSTYFSRVENL